MLHKVYHLAKEFTSLKELILFCAEDDTEVVTNVEKELKGLWNDYTDRANSFGFPAAWNAPEVTAMLYKPDYFLLQTRDKVENELSLMKDMLTGFKSL